MEESETIRVLEGNMRFKNNSYHRWGGINYIKKL